MPGSDKTKSQEQQQASTTNTIDPQELAMLRDNYTGAQTRADSLKPYTGQLTAGFTAPQIQAQGVLSGIAQDPSYSANFETAIGANQGVLGNVPNPTITPQSVSARTITPTPITVGQLSTTDLAPYMDPYTQDVINTSLAQLKQQRGQQDVADNASATAAKAFGGTRQAVQRALTGQGYDLNTGTLIANLNDQNFNQARTAALSDINNRFGASQFNAGQDLTAQTTNAGNDIATGEFNSNQGVTAQQDTFGNRMAANAGVLAGANNLTNLTNGKLALAANQGGILGAVGDQQQAQLQQELTDAYNAWAQGQQLTIAQQQLLNSALGLIPNQQTVTSSGTSSGTSTTTHNPGFTGILSSIGDLAKGLGSMGVGF